MTDLSTLQPGLESPPSRGFAVSPSASPLVRPIRGLMVASAGDVEVRTVGGDEVTLPGLQPGVQYAILATHVLSGGTTAGGVVGFA
jgi:hypothetical protein